LAYLYQMLVSFTLKSKKGMVWSAICIPIFSCKAILHEVLPLVITVRFFSRLNDACR
jgi:hypothetical protein